ncbi:NAD(P)-binding protein [Hypoxylon trugodes]|uniref:NAD(P)-binding protein n=1 Tax=Hypoxylon trugodes TaxID=326681 RepID=UPI0021966975|nr:NAD(P)-binding protein [Hypoxylon trugodes]KAI1392295.1 NAD(P)-binding protein [Hypoxylon trugodes]
MSKPWILVSPASRGIGHALTRHLLRTTTAPILATARSDLSGVRKSILDSNGSDGDRLDSASSRLHITRLDVTQEPTLESAAAEASSLFPQFTHHLHFALTLPGVLLHPEKSPRDVNYHDALETLRINVLGPLLLMKWFGEFLPRRNTDISLEPLFTNSGNEEPAHATWLTTSARVGSTSDNRLGGWYTYRASKAAVTSLTKTFDLHLQMRCRDSAISIAYHPGTVRTGLSKDYWDRVREDRLFTPEYAARRMVDVVRSRKVAEHRGKFWDWKGEEVLP